MCFYYDSQSAYYSEKIRQARVEHRCLSCNDLICIGSYYVYGTGIFDGNPFDSKFCGRCKLTQIKIYEHELAEGCHPQESWCTLQEVKLYCDETKFKWESHEDGQIYLHSLREIQDAEKFRLKTEKKNRKKDVKNEQNTQT